MCGGRIGTNIRKAEFASVMSLTLKLSLLRPYAQISKTEVKIALLNLIKMIMFSVFSVRTYNY